MSTVPLSAQQTLDADAMWSATRRLLDGLFGALEKDDAMDDALDVLVDVLGADRGLLLITTSDGGTRTINARARGRALTAEEREEVSRTIVERALESGTCISWDPLHAKGTSASFATLGIVQALAAPLFGTEARGRPRGVLYVDFRDLRKFVSDRHVEFFASAALLVSAVLDQHDRGESVRLALNEAKSHTTEARATPPLGDILAFPSMRSLAREIDSALVGDSPIFITGESGTGKTLLATAIAEASKRRPIVRATLGASDDLNTITSELFGHERGAFSGATSKRVGLVEFADGGTLILDEILNLPRHAQQLLLDFAQFGTYRPLGHARPEPKRARVRIIAATNGDMRAAIREERFRKDLFYRLAALTLEIPPLRARREDVPALAEAALRRADSSRTWTISLALRRALVSSKLGWSGNVRQLGNAIARARERAIVRDPEATELVPEHFEARDVDQIVLSDAIGAAPAASEPIGVAWQRLQAERARIDEREHEMLRRALDQVDGVVAYAARELGIARTTLSSRLDALGLRGSKK